LKNCYSCGHTVSDDAKFCSTCGTSQICLQCGFAFSANERFCTNCGTERKNAQGVQPVMNSQQGMNPMSSPTVPPYTPTKTHQAKQVSWLVWAIGAAVIVVILFLVLKGPDKPEEVVENFLEALEDQDEDKVKKYMHPLDYYLVDFSDFPEDMKVKILDFKDVYVDGNYAEVTVKVRISSKKYEMSEIDEMDFELEKIGDNWIIVDGL
jgi:uncharacterized membrane protein YvbJ